MCVLFVPPVITTTIPDLLISFWHFKECIEQSTIIFSCFDGVDPAGIITNHCQRVCVREWVCVFTNVWLQSAWSDCMISQMRVSTSDCVSPCWLQIVDSPVIFPDKSTSAALLSQADSLPQAATSSCSSHANCTHAHIGSHKLSKLCKLVIPSVYCSLKWVGCKSVRKEEAFKQSLCRVSAGDSRRQTEERSRRWCGPTTSNSTIPPVEDLEETDQFTVQREAPGCEFVGEDPIGRFSDRTPQ